MMRLLFQASWVFLIMAGSSLRGEEGVVFVSPDGGDANLGTKDNPFQTIARGLEKTRKMDGKTKGKVLSLAGGRYELSHSLVLGEKDNGLTIQATDLKHPPRLIGGRVVGGLEVLKDPVALKKLSAKVHGKVFVTDLKIQKMRDYGKLKPLGFGKGGTSAMEVFVNGHRGIRARYPNHGWLTIQSIPDGKLGRKLTVDVEADRLKNWSLEPLPWVFGYWYHGWADRFLSVEAVDVEKQSLTLLDVKHYGLRKGQRFFAMNLFCELDAPGEYWIDTQNGKLYLYPDFDPDVKGEMAKVKDKVKDNMELIVSILESPLLLINGASDVQIRGLLIEAGRGSGIVVKNSESVTIDHCHIRNLGDTGIVISGGKSNQVASCEVHDTGATGISVTGGDRKTLTPSGHVLTRNLVHHVSRLRRTYTPAISLNGVGNSATHNLLHHAPHQAISFNGNDHLIARNEIHHVVLETDDSGAIYTCPRDYTSRGTVIRENYLHHCGPHFADKVPEALRIEKNVSYEPMHIHGTSLIYLDDLTGGMMIERNVLIGGNRAMLIGGGRDNVISGNLILGGNIGIWIDGRGLGWAAKNVAKGGSSGMFRKFAKMRADRPPYVTRYPGLKTALLDHPAAPVNTVARENVVLGAKAWKKTDGKSDPYIRWVNNVHAPKPDGLPANASPKQWLEKEMDPEKDKEKKIVKVAEEKKDGASNKKAIKASGVNSIPFSEIGL